MAALSGVSLAWYTYREQGRPIHASEQVLESLACTLRLDSDERNYLFSMAAQWLVSQPAPVKELAVSPSLQYMLDELTGCPAYIIGREMEIVAWNQLACAVFGDYSKMDRLCRNLLFIDRCGEYGVTDVDQVELRHIREWLRKTPKKINPGVWKTRHLAAQTFFNWCVFVGLMNTHDNPLVASPRGATLTNKPMLSKVDVIIVELRQKQPLLELRVFAS